MKYDGPNTDGYRRDVLIIAENAPAGRYDHETELALRDLASDYGTTVEAVRVDLALAQHDEL